MPPLLAVYSLMCLANLTAGLTHYGTTTGPILYSQNYVTFGEWWRAGFAVVGREPDDLADGRLRVVEVAGVLVDPPAGLAIRRSVDAGPTQATRRGPAAAGATRWGLPATPPSSR